eukprot:g3143.t1
MATAVMPPKKKEEKAPAEMDDGVVGVMAAMRLGRKKGAKKAGEKKVRSPRLVQEKGYTNAVFKAGTNHVYLYDDDTLPLLNEGESVHRAAMKTYKNETKKEDYRVVLYEDGRYELFKSLDNVNSITKGVNVDVIYKGVDGVLADADAAAAAPENADVAEENNN